MKDKCIEELDAIISEWMYTESVELDFSQSKGLVEAFQKYTQQQVQEAVEEYKQFVLNVLDGIDIADGRCTTKAIRFALQSRITALTQPQEGHED